MKNALSLVCLAIGIFNNNLPAQEQEQKQNAVSLIDSIKADTGTKYIKTHQYKELVVSASRFEQEADETGRSITVITGKDLKNSIYNNVAELLSQQEGIYMIGGGQTPGSLQTITMRGTGSNQTSIMIDGVRITDPSSVNNMIDLSELSLANIERIEIVRGTHSTLYGTAAIGGVVNIITKKNTENGIHAGADLILGSLGSNTFTSSENGSISITDKSGFYGNMEIYNTNNKGIDATIDTVTNPSVYNKRDRDNFNKADFFGKAGYASDDFDIYLGYKYTDQRSYIDKRAYIDDDNYYVDFNRELLTYGTRLKLNDNMNIRYIGGYSRMMRKAIDDSSVVDFYGNNDHSYYWARYSGTTATNEVQMNINNKNIDLVIGASRYDESMGANVNLYYKDPYYSFLSSSNLDTLRPKASINSMFINANLKGVIISEKLKNFNLGIGIRTNSHSLYEGNNVYQINPSLKVQDNTLLYANFATAFNAPSLYQLYAPEIDLTSGVSRGNDNLLPETSQSYEFGVKQNIGNKLIISGSYFNTVVNNAIEYVYLWEGSTPYSQLTYLDYRGDTYLNIGKQSIEGLELKINSKLSEKISWGGNISLISGRVTYDPNDLVLKQTKGNHVQIYNSGVILYQHREVPGLTRRPNTGNLFVTYNACKQFMIRADLRYVGSRTDVFYDNQLGPFGALNSDLVKPYTLMDVTMRFNITEQFSAGIKFENLFDTNYIEIAGYNTKRRSTFINLRYIY